MPKKEDYLKNKNYYDNYYQANKELIKEKVRDYKQRNKEILRKLSLEYYKGNKDKIKKYQERYRASHKDKISKRDKEYAKKNAEKLKEYRKNYYNQNKNIILLKQSIYLSDPKIKKRKKKSDRKYLLKNKDKIWQQRNKRRKEDINFKIRSQLRSRVWEILKKYINGGKIMNSSRYGIDYKTIIEHLKPFPEDLSKYHIDHIKPLCSFNFMNEDGSANLNEIRKAFSPENHQWLLKEENLKKRLYDGSIEIGVRNRWKR